MHLEPVYAHLDIRRKGDAVETTRSSSRKQKHDQFRPACRAFLADFNDLTEGVNSAAKDEVLEVEVHD